MNCKFVLFNVDDIEEYLSKEQKIELYRMLETIEQKRMESRKVVQDGYLVIEQNKPYYNDALALVMDDVYGEKGMPNIEKAIIRKQSTCALVEEFKHRSKFIDTYGVCEVTECDPYDTIEIIRKDNTGKVVENRIIDGCVLIPVID